MSDRQTRTNGHARWWTNRPPTSQRRIQVDELWGFVYCKQKNVTHEILNKNALAGDVWLWVAIDAESKLVISWRPQCV